MNKRLYAIFWALIFLVFVGISFFYVKSKVSVTVEPITNNFSWSVTSSWTGKAVNWTGWIWNETKILSKEDKTLWDITFKQVDVKEIEGKKIYQLNKSTSESVEDYLKRIGKKNACYLTQYIVYNESVLNWNSWSISFPDYSFDYNGSGAITKVFSLTETPISKEDFLNKNPAMKENILKLKAELETETDVEKKKSMKEEFDMQVNEIPTSELVQTEKKLDKMPTFAELMNHYENSCNQ